MALSADAQALLELLLARGQTYADIGSLLERSESEVRQRARAALTELGGTDPDRNVALTDWILGQADPIDRADAARHVREDAADHELAASLISSLRELAPGAEFPKLPGEPSQGRFRRRGIRADADVTPPVPAAPKPPRGRHSFTSLDPRQTRLMFALGGAAILLVLVVLAIAGVFEGEEDSPSEPVASTTSTTADSSANGTQVTENTASIPLEPVGGGDASGAVTLGLTSGQQGFVELEAENLQPAPNGSTYYVWFMQDETTGYPYQPLAVEGSQTTSERFVLPNEALSVVLSARSIDVWISPLDELRKRIPQALADSTVVEIPGERVLSAPVQRAVEAAQGGGAEGDG